MCHSSKDDDDDDDGCSARAAGARSRQSSCDGRSDGRGDGRSDGRSDVNVIHSRRGGRAGATRPSTDGIEERPSIRPRRQGDAVERRRLRRLATLNDTAAYEMTSRDVVSA